MNDGTEERETQHPSWCDRRHIGRTVHAGQVGRFEVAQGVTLDVSVVDYGKEQGPVVSLVAHSEDHTIAVDLDRNRGRELFGLLGEALGLLGGVR